MVGDMSQHMSPHMPHMYMAHMYLMLPHMCMGCYWYGMLAYAMLLVCHDTAAYGMWQRAYSMRAVSHAAAASLLACVPYGVSRRMPAVSRPATLPAYASKPCKG